MCKWILVAMATFLAGTVFSQTENQFKVKWDNALKIESVDKQFQIKMGGRLQYDMMFIRQDDTLSNHFAAENGSEFRRVRLYTSGSLYDNVVFKVQLDFAKGSVVLKDVYLRLTKLPVVGNFQVGNFKEPMGFEMLTSSNNNIDLERSLTDAFTPDRNLGMMLFNSWVKKRISASAGFFYNSDGSYKYQGNAYHLTGRFVVVPYLKTGNDFQLAHLGISYSHQFHDGTSLEYESRPESHLAPKYVALNFDEVKQVNKMAAELVLVYHQFSFQSEYIANAVTPSSTSALTASSYNLHAWYGIFSWMVTGEHRTYKMGLGAFDRVIPKKNFGKDGGFGALELSVRYSQIDLNAHELEGGKLNDLTIGANWFLNPVTRISANYIRADVVDLGLANIFEMRFQLVF